MSSLVRKTIIDRNGHQTVLWANPEVESAPKASVPPAPTPPMHPMDPVARAKRLAHRFRVADSREEYYPQAVAEAIEGFQWETVHALDVELNDPDADADELMPTFGAWIGYYEHREEYLRDLLAFRGCFDPATDRDFIEQAVNALSDYDALPKCDEYGIADPAVVAAAENLLRATDTFLSDEYDLNPDVVGRFALPEDLAGLVVGRPEDFDRINELIGEGVTDPQRITMMLDSETPSLSSGLL